MQKISRANPTSEQARLFEKSGRETLVLFGFFLFKHFHAVIRATIRAYVVRQPHFVTLRALDQSSGLQREVAAASIAPPAG